jgi:hypothetical protein
MLKPWLKRRVIGEDATVTPNLSWAVLFLPWKYGGKPRKPVREVGVPLRFELATIWIQVQNISAWVSFLANYQCGVSRQQATSDHATQWASHAHSCVRLHCLKPNIVCERSSLNAIVTQSKNWPVWVNTVIQLHNITTTSDNNGIDRGVFQLTSVSVMSEVVLIFLISFAWQLLSCAIIAFGERCVPYPCIT